MFEKEIPPAKVEFITHLFEVGEKEIHDNLKWNPFSYLEIV